MQRKEAETLVKGNGGSILSGVNSKLDYLVTGEDAGSKLVKAKEIGTVKILTEKEFLKMATSNIAKIHKNTPRALKGVKKTSKPDIQQKNKTAGKKATGNKKIKTNSGKTEIKSNVSTKTSMDKKVNNSDIYSGPITVECHLYGNGCTVGVKELNESQVKFWKKKLKAGDKSDLLHHLQNYDEYLEEGNKDWYLDYFDQCDSQFGITGAFYKKNTLFRCTIIKGGQEIESFELPITNSIRKGAPSESNFRFLGDSGLLDFADEDDESYLITTNYDQGIYSKCVIQIPAGETFSLDNLQVHTYEIKDPDNYFKDFVLVEAFSFNGEELQSIVSGGTENSSVEAEIFFN
jgi:hypothetical protein